MLQGFSGLLQKKNLRTDKFLNLNNATIETKNQIEQINYYDYK